MRQRGQRLHPSEYAEQLGLVSWLNYRHIPHFAVPSEGERTKRFGGRLKAQGWCAGIPDLILVQCAPCDGKPVAIELKSATGKVTPTQRDMHALMREYGWHVLVAWGWEHATTQLLALGY